MRLTTPSAAHAALLRPHLAATHAVLDGDRLVGGLALSPVRPGTSELRFWVVPEHRRRGVATQAVRLLRDATQERLELITEITDLVSQRVALAAGFTREAERRGGGLRDGVRRDDVLWSWLPGDPPGPAARPIPFPADGVSDSVLRDGELTLRPYRADDSDDLFTLLTLPDVRARAVDNLDVDRAWYERRCLSAPSRWLAGQQADLTIRVDDEFAGDIGLCNETWSGQAMIGYAMLPAFRGRGVATRAVRLLSAWAFEIGVRRLIAGTATDNVASQRVLEKAGFVRESVQRSRFFGPGGTRVDDVLHVLLPPTG
jgi:RimJ/RimL family protein N-acetyltransferase